jgi:hypothetical protein
VTRLEVATHEHAYDLASRMRPADAEECRATGLEPLESVLRSMLISEFTRAAFIDDELAALFGVSVTGPEKFAVPWCLTSEVVDRKPMAYWRASKLVIAELLKLYPVMVQAIDARYGAALSWATRLGFELQPAIAFGPHAMPFHPALLKGR